MGKSRSATFKKNKNDTQLAVQEHETESPLIPVNQLKELNTFRPDLVDWVVQETEKETTLRRTETHRINSFVFIVKLSGQIFGLIIGLSSIGAGSYIAVAGEYSWIGATIAGTGIAGLATAFIAYYKNQKQ